MTAILDLLYREYCRARLAEMRKQLLLSVANDEIPAANWDARDSAGPDDRGRGLGHDTTTKKPQPSGNDIGSVDEPARYRQTSGASRAT
jgi:hypothetical protein